MVETNYLYNFNKKRYDDIYTRDIEKIEKLDYVEYENCFVLPAKANGNYLFGLGGVIDEKLDYLEDSGIVSRGRFFACSNQQEVNVFGGKYDIDCNNVDIHHQKSVYLGYISNHWGHFLVDFTTRLWYVLENDDENIDYIFVVKENQHFELIKNIKRFLELLGIDLNRVYFINKVTRFNKLIIPNVAYITNKYYSSQFLDVFNKVAETVEIKKKKYKGVYFTRNGWYKAKATEVGEEMLINFFKKNGYEIVSPEQITLDEQIMYIRNSEIVAGITGTIPHNMLFATNQQKLLIINKTYNFNSMQKDINIMRNLSVTYIDAYISILPVPLGDGPFSIIYNENLEKFILDYNYIYPSDKYRNEKFQIKILKRFHNLLRQNMGKEKNNYVEDENNSTYFDSKHLTYYYSNYYFKINPISIRENLILRYSKVKIILSKILSRLKEKIL